jgi:hypothetical protein
LQEPLTAFPGRVVHGLGGFVGVGGVHSRRFIAFSGSRQP